MTIPGYDPDDLDAALERVLADRDTEEYLTSEEQAQWEAGEGLSELLDDEDIKRLLTADGTVESDG